MIINSPLWLFYLPLYTVVRDQDKIFFQLTGLNIFFTCLICRLMSGSYKERLHVNHFWEVECRRQKRFVKKLFSHSFYLSFCTFLDVGVSNQFSIKALKLFLRGLWSIFPNLQALNHIFPGCKDRQAVYGCYGNPNTQSTSELPWINPRFLTASKQF